MIDPRLAMSESEELLTFEQALVQLETVVRDLENVNTGLDKSIERYEEGVRLLRRCRAVLDAAEQKIRLLTAVDSDGHAVTSALDSTAIDTPEPAPTREPATPARRTRTRASRHETGGSTKDEEQLFP